MNTEQFDGHTPGPWVAKFDEHGVEGSLVVEGNRDDGGFGNFTASPLWVGEFDKNMPDARLIAAAPDLLAALIEERKMHERLREVVTDAHFLIRARCTTETPFAYLRIAHMLQQALHGSEGEPLHGGEEE